MLFCGANLVVCIGWLKFKYADVADAEVIEACRRFASLVRLVRSEGGCDNFPLAFMCLADGSTHEIVSSARRLGGWPAYAKSLQQGGALYMELAATPSVARRQQQ